MQHEKVQKSQYTFQIFKNLNHCSSSSHPTKNDPAEEDQSIDLPEFSTEFGVDLISPGQTLHSNCEAKTKAKLTLLTANLSPIKSSDRDNLPSSNLRDKQVRTKRAVILPTGTQSARRLHVQLKSARTSPRATDRGPVTFEIHEKPGFFSEPYRMQKETVSPKYPTISTEREGSKLEEIRAYKSQGQSPQEIDNKAKMSKFKITSSTQHMRRNSGGLTGSLSEEFLKQMKDIIALHPLTAKNETKETKELVRPVAPFHHRKSSAVEISCICTLCFGLRNTPTRLLCGHVFCRDCIKSYIEKKIQSESPQMQCPDHQCRRQICKSDVWRLVNVHDYHKFEKLVNKACFNQF